MSDKTRQFCRFVKGREEYTDVEPRPVTTEPMPDGGTLARVRVCHASGDWVHWGTAYSTPDGLQLYYQTRCADEIAFERYAVKLEFHLPGYPFEAGMPCQLVHDGNAHLPRDISNANDFDQCANAFGWVYDNGWPFEDEHWECFAGPDRFRGYMLLRQPSARAVLIRVGPGSQEAVWRGELRTTHAFDAMLRRLEALRREAARG